jgi:lipoate-protein ligase A
MIFVDNQNNFDPRINLAIEEHLLRTLDTEDDILLFYINQPSIIIGRNQNTLEEINHEYTEKNGVYIVRRLSGGGAVYHDYGNLNFSFISNYTRDNFKNFKKFTGPVIEVLKSMGVPAELSGRNDILVEGRKISGNAQYTTSRRMYSHGTLLLDTNLEHLVAALNVKMSKIESKGIKSVRSRVANISEYLTEKLDTMTFRQRLLEGIFAGSSSIPEYKLTEQDWQAIRKLFDERYSSWEWNYGHSPDFNVQKVERFPFGEIEARIDVHKGIIQALKIFGDFQGEGDIEDLEKALLGTRFDRESMLEVLKDLTVERYFGGFGNNEFVSFLY